MQQQQAGSSSKMMVVSAVLAMALAVNSVAAVITVQIGGATRLNSLSRQRERYNCYWDCDLVGCQIARDDDECAYDCEKICRVRYDYAAGRSGATDAASAAATELMGKSAPTDPAPATDSAAPELQGAGTSVRLHLPRNASARNFAIWERCAPDASTGKLTEKPFNL